MAAMNVSSTGTGTLTLNGALAGFQTFAAAGVQNLETVAYAIIDATNTWEIGRGIYTSSGTTLTRGPIYSSSSGSAISVTSAANVAIVFLNEDLNPLLCHNHANFGGF